MGFYIRKSFRMGPMRLNLSKSGLGVSAGVRGARVGINAQGKTYAHAGRYGLYARHTFGGKPKTSSPAVGASVVDGDPDTMYEDTGVTYGRHSEGASPSVQRLENSLRRPVKPVGVFLLSPLFGLILLAVADSQSVVPASQTILSFLGLILLVAWIWPAARNVRTNWRGRRFGKSLLNLTAEMPPLIPQKVNALRSILEDMSVSAENRDYWSRIAYMHIVSQILADEKITQEELADLEKIEQVLAVSPDFYKAARADGFKRLFLEAVADHELTHDEERVLAHVKTAFAIPEDLVKEELGFARRLRELRELRAGNLIPINSSIRLQKQEECYLEAEARVLKEQNLRSFQQDGRKIRVRGFTLNRQGTLLITNKRLLVVHSGTTTIRHEKILDVEVDDDRALLVITKDGVNAPTYISTPDALRAGAILAGAMGL